MSTSRFLEGLLNLAACESLDALLETSVSLLERELGLRAYVELWDGDGTRFARGEPCSDNVAHCTWIGIRYTIGTIHLSSSPDESDDLELLARQLAPLAERLLEAQQSDRRTVREDVAWVYERRIRDALLRSDWNKTGQCRNKKC
jgi:hypothetical protein